MEVRSKWRQLHCYHPIETSLWVTSQKMQLHCKMDLRVISTDKGCALAMDHKCHTSITPLWINKIRNHFLKLCCLRQLLVKIYTGLKKSLKKHPKNNKKVCAKLKISLNYWNSVPQVKILDYCFPQHDHHNDACFSICFPYLHRLGGSTEQKLCTFP